MGFFEEERNYSGRKAGSFEKEPSVVENQKTSSYYY